MANRWLGDNGIIEEEVSRFIKLNVISHRSPEFTGRDALGIQQAIELVMTPLLAMIGEVRLREVLKTC